MTIGRHMALSAYGIVEVVAVGVCMVGSNLEAFLFGLGATLLRDLGRTDERRGFHLED